MKAAAGATIVFAVQRESALRSNEYTEGWMYSAIDAVAWLRWPRDLGQFICRLGHGKSAAHDFCLHISLSIDLNE